MKKLSYLILFLFFIIYNLTAQNVPLVYEVENTGADCPVPYLPTITELPAVSNLPDPFLWSDGRGRMKNISDWRYRRAEIKAEIENYEIGIKPVKPEDITATYVNGTLTVNIKVNGNTLTLTSNVTLPSGDGPFPAVIGMGGGTGSLPSTIFSSRNIAQIPFNYGQVMAHTQTRGSEPINDLYPELTYIGAYSAWSWGVSRLIDGLELVSDSLPIDLKHIAVTGCSFAGKMALFAGALDERIALTISQESGGGGYTTWRYSDELERLNSNVQVETLARTSHAWFIEDMFQFSSSVTKLPHDHHELMAMIAPRALLVTGNPDYVWLADESGYVGSRAAQKVWDALGVSDRFGYSIVAGHSHCAVPGSQIPEIEAFVEKFLLGNDNANTNIATTPFNTNLSSWITWTTPELAGGTSYFGKTELVSPANSITEVDTAVTLVWTSVNEAQKYLIQLATDGAFNNIVSIDSTLTDTTIFYDGLIKGLKYYWRIQVKGNDGPGPWSDVWNFSTAITLPETPEIISAFPLRKRDDYVTFKWNKSKYADSYQVQISEYQSFITIKGTATTSDDSVNIGGTNEGDKYYWRMRARNIGGSSPWTEPAEFTVVLAPSDLKLQNYSANEITLTWNDNSGVEDGYIIERKQSPDTDFSDIDTVDSGIESYSDQSIDQSHNYSYRVRAYKEAGKSDYSNVAALNLVGVIEDRIPSEFLLSQNYPNPFNPETKIYFAIPKTLNTKLTIYDLLGREVKTLVDKELGIGTHEFTFEAGNLPSGIYLYRIESGNFTQTRKMILMK